MRTAVVARGGTATVADLVVSSALPQSTVEQALARLSDKFESSIGVAKGGALVYRFTIVRGRLRARRERRPALRAFLRTVTVVSYQIARGARAGFRTMLALQLLVYSFLILAPVAAVIGAVVGVVVGIAMLIAGIAKGGGDGLEILFNPYVLGFLGACAACYGVYLGLKKEKELLLALVGKDVGAQGGVAGFVKQVNDYTLGPPVALKLRERLDRTWVISQNDERRVLSRVRARGGRLRAGDLVAWLGLGFVEADRQATRLAVEYGGEPAAEGADETAAIVEFGFPDLLETAGSSSAPAPLPEPRRKLKKIDMREATSHERGIEIPVFTGNKPSEDAFIVGFAALNLGVGLAAAHFIAKHLAHPDVKYRALWSIAKWGLGVVPAAFVALMVAIFVLRAPVHAIRRAIARRAARRKRILDAIVDRVTQKAKMRIDLEKLALGDGVTHDDLRRVAIELEGSFELDEANDPTKTVWTFPRLGAELTPARGAQAAVREVAADAFDGAADPAS